MTYGGIMLIEVQGQTIHYTSVGKGLPLIILHGLYLDTITMEHAIEDTSIKLDGFRRIYIDLPGMGQSPAHNLENSTDTMIRLLSEVIEVLIGELPFIIIGYSYGGYLAQGIAKLLNEQVIGEVLICPVVIPESNLRKKAPIINQEIDYTYFVTLSEEKQKSYLSEMVVINKRTCQRTEADFSRAIALANRSFLKALYDGQYLSTIIENSHMIHRHKTLIFLGYQDNVVGYKDMLNRLNKYPKATVSLLTNASHSFFLEQPDQFENLLDAWLRKYK
jgi:pimeloyl-ACP methyl ester carboxylesterase